MRVVHEAGDFYAIYNGESSLLNYFKYTVPTTHRRYESVPSCRWVVHKKYLSGVALPDKNDPHAILYLTKDAPRFMIDAAWKAHALHYHPDRGGSVKDFQRAKTAYEALKNDTDNDGISPKKEGSKH